MRILHIITSLRMAGAEKLMVDALPNLKSLGNDVELLSFEKSNTPFYDELKERGIIIHSFFDETSHLGRKVYNPINAVKIRKFFKDFDIVHTHLTACQFNASIASLFTKKSKCPILVTTEHSTSNKRRKMKGFRSLDRLMYQQYDYIICCSKKTETNLKEYLGKIRTPIVTIYNGVDVNKFAKAQPERNFQEKYKGYKTFLMVARFTIHKDQMTAIRAFKLLPENYHLFLAGVGPTMEECKKECERLGIGQRIHFLGLRGDIAELLHSVDVVLLSSHYEGLSISSIEGMASGKPFVASDVDGLHELVYGSGILFPEGNEEQLAIKLQKLCEDKYYYENVVKSCQEKAFQFDISVMAEKYNEVYKQLIENK